MPLRYFELSIPRKIIVFVFLIAFGISWGNILIASNGQKVEISFTSYELENPLGCVYVGNDYLAKIPPESIPQGSFEIDASRLSQLLSQSRQDIKISVFIQGFADGETLEYCEANIYSCTFNNGKIEFTDGGKSFVPDDLKNFVFGKFDFLREIRDKIRAQNAHWIADLNPVFMLPDDEFRALLGARPSELRNENNNESNNTSKSSASLLTSLDWRNVGGQNYVTPIRSQGSCGSCWAFSVNGTAESQFLVGLDKPYLRTSIDLSEQHQVSCDAANWGCDGGYTDAASDFIRDTGNPDESCFPYTSGSSGTEPPCSDRCSDWASRVKKICGWSWVNSGESVDPNNLKNGVQNAPLSVCMRVCSDFSSYSGGTYVNTCGSSGWEGWHAIILVGYDDASNYWIMKNSWNTWWGDEGFCYMDYSESNYSESRFGSYALLHQYYLDADFSFSPTDPLVGETVNFTDNTTHCLSLVSWSWNFGDGVGSSTLQNPSYVYSSAGTYAVRLIACDGNFCDTFTQNITVSPNEPNLKFYSYSINDAGGGDGDGYPERGETVMMPITLNNTGGDAINVSATLSESDPYVTLTDNSATWPDIPYGENRQSNYNHFSFSVADADVTCGHTVSFILNWSCESGTYSGVDTFNITLGCPAPVLEYQSYTIDDASGGDGDGYPERGETVSMPVTLHHIGGANAQHITATLNTTDPYVSITDHTATWPDIAVGSSEQSAPDHCDFSVSPSTPNGHIATFTIDWTCYCGSGTDTFDVTLGGPAPQLVYTAPVSILDSAGGDGDGYPEAGETFMMAVPLRNEGNDVASSVSGTITTTDSYIILIDSSATWPNIAIGDTQQTNPNHFTIKADDTTPCGHIVTFQLIDTANGDIVDTNYIDLTIGSPEPIISYYSQRIIGDDDGDGYPEQGETFQLAVSLQNSASFNAQDFSATISTSDPYISVIDDSADWSDIPASEHTECNSPYYTISALAGTPYLHSADIYLHWTSYCGSGDDTFQLVIGDPTDNAPLPPELVRPFPFERIGNGSLSIEPQLEWNIPNDSDDDLLHFIVRFGTNYDMSGATEINSFTNPTGFNSVPPVPAGSGMETYYVNSQGEGELNQSTTYWWDVSAYDGNRWSEYSGNRSFTIDTTSILSDWFQTTTAQFEQDSSTGVTISDDKVSLIGTTYFIDDDFESYSSYSEFASEWNAYGSQLFWQDTISHSPDFAIHYYDASASTNSYFYHTFTPLTDGFISCWSMTETTSDECEILRFYSDGGSTRRGQLYYREGYIAYWDGTTRHNLVAIDPGIWHHYRVDFDCSAGEVHIVIDSVDTFGPYPFIGGTPSSLDMVVTGSASYTGYTCNSYFDDYQVGQSSGINEGILVSTPIVFSWNSDAVQWDEVIWTQNSGDSIIVVADEMSSGSWIPFDSAVAVVPSTAGTLDISSLADFDTIRLRAKFYIAGSSTSPELYDWAIKWSPATVGFQMLTLDSTIYTSLITDTLEPGDTFWCDSANGIWILNESNIPTKILANAFDDTTYLPSDTLIWAIANNPGCDTCATGIAIYSTPRNPNISDVHWLSEISDVIESNVPAGENRYQYIFFVAPTDTIIYGEPDHRVKMIIKIIPR